MAGDGSVQVGFARLVALLCAGYQVDWVGAPDCIALRHPAGRRFRHHQLLIYDNGTIVGADDMRIRSFDADAFVRFLDTTPKP